MRDKDYIQNQLGKIPKEFRNLPQWVCWQWGDLNPVTGRRKKVPICPGTARAASVSNPQTWGSFNAAWEGCQRFGLDGLGFVFTLHDPYAGIDLDGAVNPSTGQIARWAMRIVASFDTYTEHSPTKTGLHLITKAKLPGAGIHAGRVEIYSSRRFFTITGDRIAGCSGTIRDGQRQLDQLIASLPCHPVHPAKFAKSRVYVEQDSDLPPSFAAAIRRNPRVRDIAERTDIFVGDTSPSGWDYNLLWIYLATVPSVPDEDLIAVGRWFRSRFHPNDPKIKRDDYWATTIRNVHARMASRTRRGRRAR